MRDYELLYIIKTELSEEQTQAVIDRYVGILEGEGATVEKVDKWGKRKLAYDINYESEGYYVLYNFESKPDFPAELERVLNITDGVLRSMVIAK